MKNFLFYISILGLSSFLAYLYTTSSKKTKNMNWIVRLIWILVIMTPAILLACFRYGVGTDYDSYTRMFDLYLQSGEKTFLYYFNNFSVGTIAILRLGKVIFNTSQGILCIYSIATIVFLTVTILYYKERIPVFTSMMIMYILLYPASFNTIRQILAVSILLFSLRFVENRKFIPFCTFLVIACLIHNTAIVAVIIYFIYNKVNKYRRLTKQIMYVIALLFPVILIGLFSIGPSIPVIGYLFTNYSMSFNTQYIVDFMFRILIYVPMIRYIKKDIGMDDRNVIYYYMALLDFEFILTSFVFEWAYRFTYFTSFAQVMLIANRINNCTTRRFRINKTIIYLVIYFVLFGLLYCLWERDNIIPYDTIFNHQVEIWRK